MSMKITLRILAALLLSTLAACSSDMSDLEQRVAEVKSRKSRAIEPIPQIKQYEAFTYNPGERGDPFTQVVARRSVSGFETSGLKPDLNRNKEPLEEFPLDALRMVGVINANGKTYAMIKAPDNVVHRVVVKDHLGLNYGEINKITESEVSILEIVPDGFGGWMQRPASLALAQ